MKEFMKNTVLMGNTLYDYALAICTFIAVIVAVTIVQRLIISRINKYFPDTEEVIDLSDILHSFKRRLLPITYFVAVYSATYFLKLPAIFTKIVDKVIIIFVAVFVILFVTDTVRILCLMPKKSGVKIPGGMISIFQAIAWIMGILFIFANLGYNVSSFITGLGIGGVAIALASPAILGDLFNYFVIIFDKPFGIGDTIQIDSMQGTVEYIGVKSTRIRSITGEQLLISNTDLTKSRLQNFKNMKKRRNLSVIGVEYSTSPDKLKMLPEIMKKAVQSVPETEFSRVHFSEFGASSLNFELAYFVLSSDYSKYIDTVQKVNYAIFDALSAEGIAFAFPSQTIYIAK